TEAREHLRYIDGVMLGRNAYHEPYRIAELEHGLHGSALPERDAMLMRLKPYIDKHLVTGGQLHHITRHLLGFYQGLPGARAYRRALSERAHEAEAGFAVIERAIAARRGDTQ